MIGGQVGDKIGGGEMASVGLSVAPVDQQAVGPAVEHAVDPDAVGPPQSAAVVVARGVEARVQSGLDGPMADGRGQPLRGGKFFHRTTGDELDGFPGLPRTEPEQLSGLRDEGEAAGLGGRVPCDQNAQNRLAFFLIDPMDRSGFVQRKKGIGGTCACTACWTPG